MFEVVDDVERRQIRSFDLEKEQMFVFLWLICSDQMVSLCFIYQQKHQFVNSHLQKLEAAQAGLDFWHFG